MDALTLEQATLLTGSLFLRVASTWALWAKGISRLSSANFTVSLMVFQNVG